MTGDGGSFFHDNLKIRVELTIKKFNFALHEKTLATIYRNKTEFDILFSF